MMYLLDEASFKGAMEEAQYELEHGRKSSAQKTLDKTRKFDLGADDETDYQDHEISCSERAEDFGLLHAYNEKWLEVRTWNNDIRGVLTLFGVFFYSFFGGLSLYISLGMIYAYMHGYSIGSKKLYLPEDYFPMTLATVVMIFIFGGVLYFTQKFFFKYELFTHRWMRIRFNRKTQKVYLLRPAFCGGLRVFDWRCTEPGLPKDKNPDAPFLHWGILAWVSPTLGEPMAAHFVGRRTSFQTQADWLAFWEFIRRYMEEGPQSVPTPARVIGYGPSLREAWISVTQWFPVLRQQGAVGLISDTVTFLISPLILLLVFGNFLGQCLTWNARFPKEIENAGMTA